MSSSLLLVVYKLWFLEHLKTKLYEHSGCYCCTSEMICIVGQSIQASTCSLVALEKSDFSEVGYKSPVDEFFCYAYSQLGGARRCFSLPHERTSQNCYAGSAEKAGLQKLRKRKKLPFLYLSVCMCVHVHTVCN